VSKGVINWFACTHFQDLNNDDALSTGLHLVEVFTANRNVAFEEEEAKIKKEVADIHSARHDNEAAARMLEKINLENASRNVTPDEKAGIYVQIAELWFEEDDAVNAEKFINKAAHIIHLVTEQEVRMRYKVCHARIMDSKRRFIVAAHSYYELSM